MKEISFDVYRYLTSMDYNKIKIGSAKLVKIMLYLNSSMSMNDMYK